MLLNSKMTNFVKKKKNVKMVYLYTQHSIQPISVYYHLKNELFLRIERYESNEINNSLKAINGFQELIENCIQK